MNKTKKILVNILTCILVFFCAFASTGCAQVKDLWTGAFSKPTDDKFMCYKLSEDGTYYIFYGYMSENGLIRSATEHIVISSTYNGLPVKEIVQAINHRFANFNSFNIVIPESVILISEGALSGENIKDITVRLDNPNYSSKSGNLYNKDKTKLIAYAAEQKQISFTIPNSVKEIGRYAFFKCKNLEKVKISNNVMRICDDAFDACFGLKDIQFEGTMAQWNEIEKGDSWATSIGATEVVCNDGTVAI